MQYIDLCRKLGVYPADPKTLERRHLIREAPAAIQDVLDRIFSSGADFGQDDAVTGSFDRDGDLALNTGDFLWAGAPQDRLWDLIEAELLK